MLYTKPDYFEQFHCIAGQCEDTCCAGWQIVVDKEALEKYKKINTTYLYKLMGCVDWETRTFRQDNEKRCAFLNEENLCDMYKNLGEDSLCKTCREYPRHTEEFDGVREITLSISCPEVARILMERLEPVGFISQEIPEEAESEDFEEFDPFLFSVLENAREAMLKILQNRKLPIQERTLLILGMAHDMQGRINRQEMFACEDVIRKYTGERALKFVKNYLRKAGKKDASFQTIAQAEEQLALPMFNKLYELELLRSEWDTLLHETQAMLFFATQERFSKHRENFEIWKKDHPDIEIHLEQILVYFLFTYFPGAVYDGEVFAKVQLSVYCTWMIELFWMARWVLNGKKITTEEMTELLYRFSREVEHSDENLQYIDTFMEKKWFV